MTYSRAAAAGILLLSFSQCMPVAALRLHGRQDPEEASKLAEFSGQRDAPVLSMDEASGFFDALANSRSVNVQERKATKTPTKVLVVIFGLMRSFKVTWPIVADQLNLKGMSEDGGHADVIVHTDLTQRCSKKEVKQRRCRREWLATSDGEYVQQILDTYWPHLKAIFNSSAFNLDRIPEAIEGHVNALADDDSHEEAGFLRSMFDSSSIQKSHLSQYTHVVAIRADSHFTQPLGSLQDVCESHPGLNVIHGDYLTMCWIHSADWDKGFLACSPELMANWLRPTGSCDDGHLPENPFGGEWGRGCGTSGPPTFDELATNECKALRQFQESGIRAGTLDDAGTFVHMVMGHEY